MCYTNWDRTNSDREIIKKSVIGALCPRDVDMSLLFLMVACMEGHEKKLLVGNYVLQRIILKYMHDGQNSLHLPHQHVLHLRATWRHLVSLYVLYMYSCAHVLFDQHTYIFYCTVHASGSWYKPVHCWQKDIYHTSIASLPQWSRARGAILGRFTLPPGVLHEQLGWHPTVTLKCPVWAPRRDQHGYSIPTGMIANCKGSISRCNILNTDQSISQLGMKWMNSQYFVVSNWILYQPQIRHY